VFHREASQHNYDFDCKVEVDETADWTAPSRELGSKNKNGGHLSMPAAYATNETLLDFFGHQRGLRLGPG
jgi:hypothetical protein